VYIRLYVPMACLKLERIVKVLVIIANFVTDLPVQLQSAVESIQTNTYNVMIENVRLQR